MPRTLKIASVQMMAEPAPTADRLARAERLVAAAAAAGAQLVVLPEVFNTGYAYTADNYGRAETLTGPTFSWMKTTARQHRVHVAGTFLLRDAEDIYNTQFIVAPDGRFWRYNKTYPWVWERAYFRGGHGIQVADTDLGKLGMLICWDSAHADLWAQYAGQVDAMVVCSCPPAVHRLNIEFPDGDQLSATEAGPIYQQVSESADEVFGAYLREQAAWLGVPVVNTTGTGQFKTHVPLAQISLGAYLLARPDKWRHFRHLSQAQVQSGYYQASYVADQYGRELAKVAPETEGFALAEVELATHTPVPVRPQPRYPLSGFAYRFDELANVLLVPQYRQGVRRAYGPQMAPVKRETKMWLGVVLTALATGLLLGVWLNRRRR